MELKDYFFIDSKRSLEENLKELPIEINNGSIFSWEYGFYNKEIYTQLLKCLEKYGEKYSINKLDKNSNHLIFTKIVDKLLDFIISNDIEKKHLFFFLTKKEISENSYLLSFFHLNQNINFNLIANHFIKNGVWSDVERLFKDKNNSKRIIYFSLILFKKFQKENNLNPSFLFEIKDYNNAKFIFENKFNLGKSFKKEYDKYFN